MTPTQKRLYDWLLERVDDPVGPTFEEMRIAMGLKSRSGIARILAGLQERGRVTKLNNRQCAVRAVRPNALEGVSTAVLIDELKRRGEWLDAR